MNTATEQPTKKQMLRDEIVALKQQALDDKTTIEKLTADLKQKTSYYEMYSRTDSEKTKIINELHSFLDAMPNPPPRKMEDNYQEYSVTTRLGVFLATRGG